MRYHLDGTGTGSYYDLVYSHNDDNFLTEIESANGPAYHFDASQATYLDGLGRLKLAGERLTRTDDTTVLQVGGHQYDRRSQVTRSQMQVGGQNVYYESYSYDKAGNLDTVTDLTVTPHVDTTYTYDGDVLSDYDGLGIGVDLNGQLTNTEAASSIEWNWEGMLRSAQSGSDTVTVKYNPLDQRVSRDHDDGSTVSKRRYVTATINGLSQILLELDGNDPNIIEKAYFYADDQVLVQYDGDPNWLDTPKYYYIHDRLGSVRMVMDVDKNIEHLYTYKPFGEAVAAHTESAVNAPENPFRFTSQDYDEELEQYYLRARQYDPELGRFLSFDPLEGDYEEPLTLHRYLYSFNDPVNNTDITGEIAINIASGLMRAAETYAAGIVLTVASVEFQSLNMQVSDMLFRMGEMMFRLTPVAFAFGMAEGGLGGAKGGLSSGQVGVCFVGDTEVSTPEGLRSISEIDVGDTVWAWDENSGQVSPQEVTAIFDHFTNELIVVVTGDETIETTHEHPFYVAQVGWVPAGELQVDDLLITQDNEHLAVKSVECVSQITPVFNIEVAGAHTYYVSAENVLVHNMCQFPRIDRFFRANQELIAKGIKIHNIKALISKYGGKPKQWKKMKSWDEFGNEWHWFEKNGQIIFDTLKKK